jgi:hypothetical protein
MGTPKILETTLVLTTTSWTTPGATERPGARGTFTRALGTIASARAVAGLLDLFLHGIELSLLFFSEYSLDLVGYPCLGHGTLGDLVNERRGCGLNSRSVSTVTNRFLQGLVSLSLGFLSSFGRFGIRFHDSFNFLTLFFRQIQLTQGTHDHETLPRTVLASTPWTSLELASLASHPLSHAWALGTALLLMTASLSQELGTEE